MSRNLPTLPPGRERIERLVETWPSDIKQTSEGDLICSAAGILRWMARILEEEGPQVPRLSPSNALLSLSLAEFPAQTDREKEEKRHRAISTCMGLFGYFRDTRDPNVFKILESPPMLKTLWSEPQNLLYKTQVWSDCNGVIDLIDWPVTRIATAGLIYIDDPKDLAAAVQSRLGISKGPERFEKGTPFLFFNPTPPQFIRVRWNNNSDSQYKSAFQALQAFELGAQSAQLETGELTFPFSTTGYRLVCCVKISKFGEKPYAPHFYTCDGRYFVPPTSDSKRDWSCGVAGRYYLIYYKSEAVRRISLERAAPFPNIEAARRKGSSASGTTAQSNPPIPITKKPERKTPLESDRDKSNSPPHTLHSQASKYTPAATPSNQPPRRNLLPRLSKVPSGPRAFHRPLLKSPELPLQPMSHTPNQSMPAKRDERDADDDGRTVRIRDVAREIPSPPRKRRKSDDCVPESVFWKSWGK